jgi:hypothetical protein
MTGTDGLEINLYIIHIDIIDITIVIIIHFLFIQLNDEEEELNSPVSVILACS